MTKTYYIEEIETNDGNKTYQVYIEIIHKSQHLFVKDKIYKDYLSKLKVGKHQSYYTQNFDNLEEVNEVVDKNFAYKVEEFNKEIKSTKLLKTIIKDAFKKDI